MEGKAYRDSCARLSHAKWKPPADRLDPVEILEASNQGRLPELIPVRYGRMIPSPLSSTAARRRSWQPILLIRHYGDPGSGLWGRPPDELWGVRHPGATISLRHQRL